MIDKRSWFLNEFVITDINVGDFSKDKRTSSNEVMIEID